MPSALFSKALDAWRSGDPARALDQCTAAIARDAEDVDAHRLLVEIHAAAGRIDAALAAGRRVATLAPRDAGNLRRLAVLLTQCRQPEAAVVVLEQALQIEPENARALNNLGHLLHDLGRVAEAMPVLQRALTAYAEAAALDQNDPRAWLQMGRLALKLGRAERALPAFTAALGLLPGDLSAQEGRVQALMALNRHEEVVPAIAALRAAARWNHYLQGHELHARLHCADWRDFEAASRDIALRVARGERVDLPLSFIVHNDSPADQLACARTFMADQLPLDARAVSPGAHGLPPDARAAARQPRGTQSRLRVAYLSPDFREHPVAQLLVGVIEAHDTARFETHAFATGADDGSVLRRRLEAGFDHFHDVAAASDRAIAERMTAAGIDIVVDLGGHTLASRTPLLAYRPAPVQVSWIGFPGTLGADFIDYIVADRHVIPEAERAHYAEQVIYLPDCYLPGALPGAPPDAVTVPPTRAAAGLPDAGIVYCGFNSPHKILPAVFDGWMRILDAVPGSVLWLRDAAAVVKRNHAQEAQARGVDPARLVYARKVPTLAEHSARLALADLFLDTYPYNAHTTASDALAAGVPVLTLRGRSFASRVATSLLFACGLGAVSVDTLTDYERRAIELARDPVELERLKAHLLAVRPTAPLFDAARLCRHLEAAYLEIWARHERGERPTVLHVG